MKDHLYGNDEASNLPPEAFIGSGDEWLEVDDFWLSGADADKQVTAMRVWFDERYMNGHRAMEAGQHPAAVYGLYGAYDPAEVLTKRFKGKVWEEVLQQGIAEFLEEGGRTWARRPEPSYDYDGYNEDFAISVNGRTQPLANAKDRIADARELATLTGSTKAQELARRSAFSAAIAALESFLWETMVFWVECTPHVVKNIITRHPHFREQPIKLGTIFDRCESLKEDILGHMQHIVWHNWKTVGPLFKYGLGLAVGLDEFAEAIKKRHDIVHRSGYTKDGHAVSITAQDIDLLCSQVLNFATWVTEQIDDLEDDLPF